MPRMLARQAATFPCSRAAARLGSRILMSSAMMATTTSSSMSVKAGLRIPECTNDSGASYGISAARRAEELDGPDEAQYGQLAQVILIGEVRIFAKVRRPRRNGITTVARARRNIVSGRTVHWDNGHADREAIHAPVWATAQEVVIGEVVVVHAHAIEVRRAPRNVVANV